MKKGIKVISLALLSAMVLLLGACGKSGGERSLYARGLDVVSLMDELAGEPYAGSFTGNEQLLGVLQTIHEGDHTAPSAVYKVTVPDEKLMGLVQTGGEGSGEARAYVRQRALSSLANQVNAEGGVMDVAASGVCCAEKTFVSGELTENVLYVYAYENAAPAVVAFLKGEDGAVTATGYFILNEAFACRSVEEVEQSFGWVSVKAELVTGP